MKIAMSVLGLVLLPLGLLAAPVPAEVAGQFELRTQTGADGASLPYRLLKPARIDPGAAYPLVLFLHGAGERGSNNTAQIKNGVEHFASDANRAAYPCFVAVPQCPLNHKWSNVDWSALSNSLPSEPSTEMKLAMAIVDSLQREFRIDARRIYVTGISMGGYGTWDAISRYPDRFAAAVPVCGGGDEKQAARLARLPIWCFHGDADTAVPVARSRNMIAAIQAAGGAPKYTEYPGVGHNAWDRAYADPALLAWLFAQSRT